MSNWDDISDEDLYELHNLLGVASSVKEKEDQKFSEILDNLSILRKVLSTLSDEFIINISNKIAEMIHVRAKKKLENQDNT